MDFPKKLPIKKILRASMPAFISSLIVLALILFFTPDFKVDYSFTLYSSDGKLLGASAASDGQWRFPQTSKLPEKYREALLSYEDKNFYRKNSFGSLYNYDADLPTCRKKSGKKF